MRQLQLPIASNSALDHLYDERARLSESQRATNTLAAYAQDWKMFQRWCVANGRESLPASSETVSLYLTDLLANGRKVSTAIRRTSGITHTHRSNGLDTPVNSAIWALISGAKRAKQEQPRQMRPLTVEHLHAISRELGKEGGREALRDRALLVFGFASALRRGTLAELLTTDLTESTQGLKVSIRREKQDQEGRGRAIGVPFGKNRDTCPVLCLQDWLTERGTKPGPLFIRLDGGRDAGHSITGATVGRRIRLSVARIGLDPKVYCGHSLRSGFITEAGYRGLGEFLIAAHTGHKSMEILRRYFRQTDLFRSNPAGLVGL